MKMSTEPPFTRWTERESNVLTGPPIWCPVKRKGIRTCWMMDELSSCYIIYKCNVCKMKTGLSFAPGASLSKATTTKPQIAHNADSSSAAITGGCVRSGQMNSGDQPLKLYVCNNNKSLSSRVESNFCCCCYLSEQEKDEKTIVGFFIENVEQESLSTLSPSFSFHYVFFSVLPTFD